MGKAGCIQCGQAEGVAHVILGACKEFGRTAPQVETMRIQALKIVRGDGATETVTLRDVRLTDPFADVYRSVARRAVNAEWQLRTTEGRPLADSTTARTVAQVLRDTGYAMQVSEEGATLHVLYVPYAPPPKEVIKQKNRRRATWSMRPSATYPFLDKNELYTQHSTPKQ